MHCVDLGESFQTHIFLQNLASIQPRTSPVKFARPSTADLVDPVVLLELRGVLDQSVTVLVLSSDEPSVSIELSNVSYIDLHFVCAVSKLRVVELHACYRPEGLEKRKASVS